jgi:hypothetical protein
MTEPELDQPGVTRRCGARAILPNWKLWRLRSSGPLTRIRAW